MRSERLTSAVLSAPLPDRSRPLISDDTLCEAFGSGRAGPAWESERPTSAVPSVPAPAASALLKSAWVDVRKELRPRNSVSDSLCLLLLSCNLRHMHLQ